MTTIILSKRTMAPRNILNNVVEGDVKLLMKAKKWFSEACRSIIGYKQIAEYLGVSIMVVSDAPTITVDTNSYNPKEVLFNELARTNTLALHNVDRIVKNVYKSSKDILSEEEKMSFREVCIQLREELKDTIMCLPHGWYFISTCNVMDIITKHLKDVVIQEEVVIEETPVLPAAELEPEEDDTPWYM